MVFSNRTNDDLEQPPSATLVEPLLPSSPSQVEPAVVLASDPSQITVEQVFLDPEILAVDESHWDHGEIQSPSCRNWFWAALFLCQLGVVVSLAIMAVAAVTKGDYHFPHKHDSADHFSRGLVFLGATTLSIAATTGCVTLILLGPLADMMIQLSLVLSPLSCMLGCLGSLLVGQLGAAAFMGVFSVIGVCYAVQVWHRIPFATANLAVALEAIKANKGVIGMAYVATFLAMVWTFVWIFAVAQVSLVRPHWIMSCIPDADGEPDCRLTSEGKWILVGLLLCFYWTSQVIRNVLHTTVAGVVGTFWFAPSDAADGCFNPALYDSWVRSMVYSFGSICLGSLLVALLQVLQFIVRVGRNQRDEDGQLRRQDSIIWCLLQCAVDQIERLVEYINLWAFVYVGLYGYDYATAGYKVYQLFRARGWSVILNDHLISRSLGMMQVFIVILSGFVSVVLGHVLLEFSVNTSQNLLIGMILGYVLSSIQFQVVTSAVDTIVVCFAEAPSALLEHHPAELSSRLIQAWRVAYPDECGF